MNLSEEWKSMWPISSVFSSPLLLLSAAVHGGATSSSSKSQLGPLFFNPSPQTLTLLFSSPSLSPLLPPSFPSLSVPRFLSTTPSSSHPFSLLPSTASSLSSSLLPLPHPPPLFLHNRLISLRLISLRLPSSSSLLLFFPTGHNFDQVGFLMLSVKNSKLILNTHDSGGIFTAKNKLNHQILRLLVSPAANSSWSGSGEVEEESLDGCALMSQMHIFFFGTLGCSFEDTVLGVLRLTMALLDSFQFWWMNHCYVKDLHNGDLQCLSTSQSMKPLLQELVPKQNSSPNLFEHRLMWTLL